MKFVFIAIILASVALCAILPWSANQLSLASLHNERVKLEELTLQQGVGAGNILRAEGPIRE